MKNGKTLTISPVSASTASLIEKLHEALKAEFGSDFAYTIAGKGHFVAASNCTYGHIEPVIRVKDFSCPKNCEEDCHKCLSQ